MPEDRPHLYFEIQFNSNFIYSTHCLYHVLSVVYSDGTHYNLKINAMVLGAAHYVHGWH